MKSERSASDIVLTTLATIASMAYSPLVFQYGWLQFVVPLGVPELSYPQAFGIILMLVVFVKHLGDGEDNSFSGHKVAARLIVMGIVHLVFFLLGGQP